MIETEHKAQKTLPLSQTWFLGVSALAVVLMFAFVIVPYLDPKQSANAIAGEVAQDFDLELISGGAPGDRIRLSDLRGKPVILDFWASWCKPCREQAQVLVEASAAIGERAHILGVATSDQRADSVAYLAEVKLPYSNAFDEEGLVGRAYQVTQLPALVIIDAKGQIRGRYSHLPSVQRIVELVEQVELIEPGDLIERSELNDRSEEQ